MAEHHPTSIQDLANRFAEDGVSFGKMADAKMPFTRPTKSEALAQGFHVRLAAVLLTLVPSQGQWCLVLMKRPEYPGVHSGQISIPGGEVEAEDTDDLSTALREFEEEMGVMVRRDDVIARSYGALHSSQQIRGEAFHCSIGSDAHVEGGFQRGG